MKTRIFSRLWSAVFFVMTMILFLSCDKEKVEGIPDILFNPSVTYGSVTDQDGNTYRTVVIGDQEWMAENLKTTKYRNGDPIQYFADIQRWKNLTSGAYCCYENQEKYKEAYGFFYNRYAAEDSRNLAPEGWHVATNDDWSEMIDFLGGSEAAHIKVKEAGKGHWLEANEKTTNESGLTLLPGGYLFQWQVVPDGGMDFWGLGDFGSWWTTDGIVEVSHGISLTIYEEQWGFSNGGKSVRCVRDR